MKNIYCAFHPTQSIVNFCRRPECLLPMCPCCIKLHASEHQSNNTHGSYENIFDVQQSIEDDLKHILKVLVDSSQDLKEVLVEKQQKRQTIKQKMHDMKAKVLKNIDRFIEDLQKKILNRLGGAETNLEQEITIIDTQIDTISKQIHREIAVLQSEKVLKGMIQIFTDEKIEHYQQQIEDIEGKIRKIEQKDVTICKQFRINQMDHVLQSVKDCYHAVFVGSTRSTTKRQTSRVSLRTSRYSETL